MNKNTMWFLGLFTLAMFQVIFIISTFIDSFLNIYAHMLSIIVSFILLISFASKVPNIEEDSDEDLTKQPVLPSYADINMNDMPKEKVIIDEKNENKE